MIGSGKSWLYGIVLAGFVIAGSPIHAQQAASPAAETSVAISDLPSSTPAAQTDSPGKKSPETPPSGNAAKADGAREERAGAAAGARRTPEIVRGPASERGPAGAESPASTGRRDNPLRDSRTASRGLQRPQDASQATPSQTPVGPSGPPTAQGRGTPSAPPAGERTATAPAERARVARTNAQAAANPTGLQHTSRAEQPKPKSWWDKLNPFRKKDNGGATNSTAAARPGVPPPSADATRRAFTGFRPSPPGQTNPKAPPTEWAFGKRNTNVPTTPTASRSDAEPDSTR